MAIDNDTRVSDREDTIRKIQDYQQSLEDLEASSQLNDARELQNADSSSQAGLQSQDDVAQAELDAGQDERDLEANDVQAQLAAQEIARVNEAREPSGMEKSDEAVSVASTQQDRGQAWQAFSSSTPEAQIPVSVEDQAAQQRNDAQQQEKQQINVRELMNQMTINSGRIGG